MSIGAINQHATTTMANRLARVIQRGDDAIDRRVASLNNALAHVTEDTKLTTDVKTSLQERIQANLDGLTELKTELHGNTLVSEAKADAKSIVQDFRVYREVMPAVQTTVKADHQLHRVDRMQALVEKFETKIDEHANNGESEAALTAVLEHLKSELAMVTSNNSTIAADMADVTPADLPAGEAAIAEARAKLHASKSYLHSAREDVAALVNALA